jgi:hypothetical protein
LVAKERLAPEMAISFACPVMTEPCRGQFDGQKELAALQAHETVEALQGGFIPGYTRYGEKFERPPTGKSPEDIVFAGASDQMIAHWLRRNSR